MKLTRKNRYEGNTFLFPDNHTCIVVLFDNDNIEKATVIIDKEDYDKVKGHKWCLSDGYAYNGEFKMEHLILGIERGRKVMPDHINRNRLDNRKTNLKIATQGENNFNVSQKNNTSGCKGVTWNKKARKWKAQIRHAGRYIYLGLFTDIEKAAMAYEKAALEHYRRKY